MRHQPRVGLLAPPIKYLADRDLTNVSGVATVSHGLVKVMVVAVDVNGAVHALAIFGNRACLRMMSRPPRHRCIRRAKCLTGVLAYLFLELLT